MDSILNTTSGGDINLATCKHITSDGTRLKEIEDRSKLDNLKWRAVDDERVKHCPFWGSFLSGLERSYFVSEL